MGILLESGHDLITSELFRKIKTYGSDLVSLQTWVLLDKS
jgi:hypothetical protein